MRDLGLRKDILQAIVPYETLGELLDELEMFTGLDLLNEEFSHENFDEAESN